MFTRTSLEGGCMDVSRIGTRLITLFALGQSVEIHTSTNVGEKKEEGEPKELRLSELVEAIKDRDEDRMQDLGFLKDDEVSTISDEEWRDLSQLADTLTCYAAEREKELFRLFPGVKVRITRSIKLADAKPDATSEEEKEQAVVSA